jgi:hypothetical protein
MKRVLAVVLLSLAVVLGGCLGSKQTWTAQPVATAEVRIAPQEVYRRKDRIFVRVTLTNLTKENITVDRDGVSLQLEGGRVLGRSSGMTTQHHPYTVVPNGAHSVYVDFRDDGIDEGTNAANVVWKGAVYAGARELAIPPTPILAR